MGDIEDIIKQSDYNRAIFDTTPLQLFIVDEDVRILDCNATANKALGGDKSLIYRRRGGEVLHCLHSTDVPEGSPVDVALAVNLGPLPLAPGTRYTWRMAIDGDSHPDWVLAFTTRPAAAPV